ncbi:MAG TPA: methyltransferase domain-containing protein [Azospirillum sp.]
MKRRLMDLIRCPACGGRLDLRVQREAEEAVDVPVPAPACRQWCARHDRSLESRPAGFAPDCRACYAADVREGTLGCRSCHARYPVVHGVPRLFRDAADPAVFDPRSNDSFGLQWERHRDGDRTWFKDDLALRRGEFLQSLDLPADALRGALVLDGGCGNGRLTTVVSGYGAEVVGMDLSRSVDGAERRRPAIAGERAPFVHFIQGNIMEPPLAPAAFDHIHSSGVLHHTPDTHRAFRAFRRLVRPGGRVYVQLYRRREAWVGIPNRLIRALTCRLPVGLLHRLCWAAVPPHTALVRLVARLRGEETAIHEASRGERALSLFDNYSPRYQYRYHPAEVRRMFEAEGLAEVKDVTLANEARHMVAFVGTRPAEVAAPRRQAS